MPTTNEPIDFIVTASGMESCFREKFGTHNLNPEPLLSWIVAFQTAAELLGKDRKNLSSFKGFLTLN